MPRAFLIRQRMVVQTRTIWVVTIALVGLLCHRASMQQAGQGDPTPLPDGTPLQGEQFPRFLSPAHDDEFGFDDFLVLGDHPVIQFERRDPDEDLGFSLETWSRSGTTERAGRVVSVFRLVWPAARLRDALRTQRWGVDRPFLRWGEIVVPGVGSKFRRQLYLQIVPPNIPRSAVARRATRCNTRATR